MLHSGKKSTLVRLEEQVTEFARKKNKSTLVETFNDLYQARLHVRIGLWGHVAGFSIDAEMVDDGFVRLCLEKAWLQLADRIAGGDRPPPHAHERGPSFDEAGRRLCDAVGDVLEQMRGGPWGELYLDEMVDATRVLRGMLK